MEDEAKNAIPGAPSWQELYYAQKKLTDYLLKRVEELEVITTRKQIGTFRGEPVYNTDTHTGQGYRHVDS